MRRRDFSPSVLRNWMRLVEHGGTEALAAGKDVVPDSRVREVERQVKELQRLVGKLAASGKIGRLAGALDSGVSGGGS